VGTTALADFKALPIPKPFLFSSTPTRGAEAL